MSSFIRSTPMMALWGILFFLPAGWYAFLGLSGGLGPDPVEIWHHMSGQWAIWVLIATMAVTPVRLWAGISFMSWRRHLGLISAAYALTHLVLWGLDQGAFSRMASEIIKRPHITVGMVAVIIYLMLSVTSNRASIKRLGRSWQKVHWWIHPLAALVVVHHVWSLKTIYEPEWIIQLVLIVGIWVSKWMYTMRRRVTLSKS